MNARTERLKTLSATIAKAALACAYVMAAVALAWIALESRPMFSSVQAKAPDDGALAAPEPAAAALPPPDTREYDLVIRNARIMDPESGLDAIGEIGIIGERIEAISMGPLAAKAEVDAEGKVAAPGFIDSCVPITPNSDSMRYVEWWKLADGVTTTLWLHDGVPSWKYGAKTLPQDGHWTEWGFGFRTTSIHDAFKTMPERLAALDSYLSSGGLTVGASPEYAPWISTDQHVEYAKVAAKHGVPYCMHTRYAFKHNELEGIREAIEIARRSGAHLHIFHLPSTGGTWHMAEALAMIEEARSLGLRVDASAYMYSYWMTFIDAAARLGEGWQEGLGLTYEDLYYVPWGTVLTKATYAKAKKQGGLVVVPEGTIDWETSIMPALAKDWLFIATDGAYDVKPDGRQVISHPRDTGGVAQALAEARERGIPLMTAIRKLTLDPARLLESSDPSFKDRGRLRVGALANITVFDPLTVRGMGTIVAPAAISAGIEAVILRGKLAFRKGKHLGAFGLLIRGER
jgi:hypothetical protein